jgi:hypothetical protein
MSITNKTERKWDGNWARTGNELTGTGRVSQVRLTCPGLPWGVPGPKTTGADPRQLPCHLGLPEPSLREII